MKYISGQATWRYPRAGDPVPPDSAKCLILTQGGVCIVGIWGQSPWDIAWAPLPKRDKEKEDWRLPEGYTAEELEEDNPYNSPHEEVVPAIAGALKK